MNGASGIAVGMATNIPPHNTTEICNAIVHLIGHPDASVDDLMQFVTGPDFPTGAHIWGQEGIRNAYVTGRGRVMVQADHVVEDIPRQERKRLVFNEIPDHGLTHNLHIGQHCEHATLALETLFLKARRIKVSEAC